MDENFLYHQIAESIRREILEGNLKPGDRLPSVRQLMHKWDCTPGTIQRAYRELSRQGLLISQAGKGTRVGGNIPSLRPLTPLRRAIMVNKAEAFLLESITTGYTLDEVQQSFELALDRWRTFSSNEPHPAEPNTIIFYGSHDLAVAWLASHFQDILPGAKLEATFTGSLGGLIALSEGKADLVGAHLWDVESDTYNVSYIRKLLPGKSITRIILAYRRLGLILPAGNPREVKSLANLASGLHFVNRQSGSGTRVWLDANLVRLGIKPNQVRGYTEERLTHSEVARAIAEGKADVGLGLEQSAASFGLDFIFLTNERYDLITLTENMDRPEIKALIDWLGSPRARECFNSLQGYDTHDTGTVETL